MLVIRPSKKALITLICIAVVVFLVDGYLYYNRAHRLNVLQLELKEKQEKLESSTQIAQRLKTVEDRKNEVQAELSILEQGVSTRAYVPSLLRQLEDLGRQNNLKVVGVRPQPITQQQQTVSADTSGSNTEAAKPKKEPYDKLNIDIQMTGSYWNVVSFLDRITSFPKIIAVREVQLIPETGPNSNEISSNISLNIKLSTTAFILKLQDMPVDIKVKDQAKDNTAQVGGA